MRLERLEINGFKSFSDRSELAFDRGVTAIVGPNGCGKSNVADAITWVMGEQSAKSLRGDKMEDVIFSGSDARKPTAAAEVRLRFSGVLKTLTGPAFPPGAFPDLGLVQDESAETVIQSVAREVEVTRRLYRSGESEYLIDGQSCRLRDIHDLLMDTGLGAKAYAIIEQGKIGLILSSRPTDRRQLIEEAAGVTKYKTRRRAAELKLEAARQNLTRIADIVFEVEKQTGSLKRQAAKARRYQRLRDEMRRWEKVLFARRYRQLAETIQLTKDRLVDARDRESVAAGHVSEVESGLGRLRIELVEAESTATRARESAHARELAITRQQQHVAFEREQIHQLTTREAAVSAEIALVDARREPARMALAQRRVAAADALQERDRAQATLASESEAYETAHREIEGFEADVEAARSEVYSAINAATALRHSVEHAALARDRVLESLSKLQIEGDDLRIEGERVGAEQAAAAEGRRRAQEALEATRIAKAARESELASARIEHDWRARTVRAREQELAGLEARLASIEELQAGRAEYGDAPRTVLAQANGKVGQQGAVADYLEVEAGYERAVEACLGELLQHVIVERPEHAAAGFQLVREQAAGRCGFLIASGSADVRGEAPEPVGIDGLVTLSSVVHVNGDFRSAIESAIGEAWIADSYDRAHDASARSSLRVATLEGDVFRGPHLVSGGVPQQQRGILETKREVKDLAQRIVAEHEELNRLREETAAFDSIIAQAQNALSALGSEHHRQEKTMVALEAQLQRASEGATRIAQKTEQLARERRQAEEERDALERRHEEAHASIARLGKEQRLADDALAVTQRRLFEAREATQDLSRRAAEAGATHAALVERAAGLAADVLRLEEATVELEARAAALEAELTGTRARVETLRAEVVAEEAALDENIRALEIVRATVSSADETVSSLRVRADECEATIRIARSALEALRAAGAELAIASATAEAELAHLVSDCFNAVQATLDEVLVEVAELERLGSATPDAAVICADESDESADADADGDAADELTAAPRPSEIAVAAAERQTLSAEEAIAALRARIDRLGPVNMMAIQQFEELESRRGFLTTQRQDLLDAIAQTTEAITRIDETTRQRFTEAFVAINRNFQEMFSTLFGGGRAGLTLLDENDPLESGIEIVAQPPGKRLQSVQLLSGGEKALTAISLMFGLFKYKPSPFCLLDEIDAPLDDANIGRFVGMLQSMQQHTQFILITHNRKTMEIADRLYGVTMEEPGVSKLISVQLN
jgi:chromosome segregation protein